MFRHEAADVLGVFVGGGDGGGSGDGVGVPVEGHEGWPVWMIGRDGRW